MQEYNILQAIFMSFYSRKLYRDVAVHWGGKAFLYLLFLIFLSSIAITYFFQHSINVLLAKNSDQIVKQIPVMTIKNGVISTPEHRPYFITDATTNEKMVVIDTTGQYKTTEQASAPILVTDKTVITHSKPHETQIYEIPTNLNIVIEPQQVSNMANKFLGYSWIFIFLFFVIACYIYRIIQALLYSIIGKIYSAITGAHLTYGQVLQIMMVAITPAIVVGLIIDYYPTSYIKHTGLICFILAMFYLFYGISANKHNS